MNETIKERWVSALRSKKFPQTKEHLKDNNGFCCLGVLCEIAVEDGVIAPPTKHPVTLEWLYENEGGTLPPKVMEWAEINEENPYVEYTQDGGYFYDSLSELNDAKSMTFPEIADIIEKEL